MGKRILLTTFGSVGDLYPYLAVAIALKARGHEPVLLTNHAHRQRVEAEGVEFHALRPNLDTWGEEGELMRRTMDLKGGPEFLVRQVMMPALRDSLADTADAAEGAALIVTHGLTYTASLVAEKRGLPWLSSALAPLAFFSAFDPPVLAPAPAITRLRPILGPTVFGSLLRLMQKTVTHWAAPWHALRQEMGLPPTPQNPMFAGQFSPFGTLALYSSVMGGPQPDWPAKTAQTGFPFYEGRDTLDPALSAFLESGDAPLVFTLGSSAVLTAGGFYDVAAEAAEQLGKRAVLLVGSDRRNRSARPLPPTVAAFDYAPFSALFPRAAAIIHQGGIGTTAQALRAGKPSLFVPFAFDQPDNAERVRRLGAARVVPRSQWVTERAVRELSLLLKNNSYAQSAEQTARQISSEHGAQAACDAIENALARKAA